MKILKIMPEFIRRLPIFTICLTLVLSFAGQTAAQKRRKPAPKKAAAVVENASPEGRAEALENLQGAKVFQLLAALQLGLAEAYLDNRAAGETKATGAMTKLMIEKLRHPTSIYTFYANARGAAIWMDYLLDRNDSGNDAESDKQIKTYHESLRKDVEKGLALKENSAHLIAARGTLREFDCRLKIKSSFADCSAAPLADFSRAIALQPDETDFYSLRAAFYKRAESPGFAADDEQTATSLGNALGLKLEIDKTATARRPLHTERANADVLYFMIFIRLLQQDQSVKEQLKDAATLESFRKKLLEYYALADTGLAKANTPRPSAENFVRRGGLRYHLGLFAGELGIENSFDFAQKNYHEAVAFYTDALRLNAKFADAYQNRARAYRKLDQKDLAEADEKQFDLLQK